MISNLINYSSDIQNKLFKEVHDWQDQMAAGAFALTGYCSYPYSKIATVASVALAGYFIYPYCYKKIWGFLFPCDENDEILEDRAANIDWMSDDFTLQKGDQEGFDREIVTIKKLKEHFKNQQGQFETLLEKEYSSYFRFTFMPSDREIIYKALKIREIYQSTHDVFIHGRSVNWEIFSYFSKKLIQAIRSNFNGKLFEFLRAPAKTYLFHNASELLKKTHDINDHYCYLRNELISADAYWLSEAHGESAMFYFYNKSTNIPSIRNACYSLIASCLDKKIPNRQLLIQSYLEKIQQIELKMEKNPGELVVICIPKSLVRNRNTNPVYRAVPLGNPHSSHKNGELDIPFLDKLQQDENPEIFDEVPIEVKFGSGKISVNKESTIQYRLLASQLTPKNGVRIFGVNALSKEEKETYKEPIQKIVQEIAEELRH